GNNVEVNECEPLILAGRECYRGYTRKDALMQRSRAALISSLLLFALVRCGSDPELVTNGPSNDPGGEEPDPDGGATGVSKDPPPIDLPSAAGSDGRGEGGGAGCIGADCEDGLCGNGELDPGEVCDDGNAEPGDGCSGLCRVEPNFECKEPG